jgi:hypothetical protein
MLCRQHMPSKTHAPHRSQLFSPAAETIEKQSRDQTTKYANMTKTDFNIQESTPVKSASPNPLFSKKLIIRKKKPAAKNQSHNHRTLSRKIYLEDTRATCNAR